MTLRTHDRSAGNIGLALLALVLLAAFGAAYHFFGGEPDADAEKTPVLTERKVPSVITAITALARLESVQFHMERVVDLKAKEQALWGLVEAEDSLLLVAVGDVTAGVDLAKLNPGDVVIDETRHQVRIKLPPPEVFSARLDSQRTYVHKRDTDLLATGGQGLETEARKRAEAQIHDAALKGGILEHARRNAGHTVRAIAVSFGYDNVMVEWRSE